MVTNFADRLNDAIRMKGNPCVVGLDPRLDQIPTFVTRASGVSNKVRSAITDFNRIVIETAAPLVPAVKLQVAFYEQYGLEGLQAFVDTIQVAKAKGLIVIADAKRNDIASTAEAYAGAFLGKVNVFGSLKSAFDVDCMTVSPFLGRDSIEPFVAACERYGKGVFILVKTSNVGSGDLQDQKLATTGERLYERVARVVEELGQSLVGDSGYSSVGAVVGATFPEQAKFIRTLLQHAIILVPGYGAQGGTARDVIDCFKTDGFGAVVNASRSITFAHKSVDISEQGFIEAVHSALCNMIEEITLSLRNKISGGP